MLPIAENHYDGDAVAITSRAAKNLGF